MKRKMTTSLRPVARFSSWLEAQGFSPAPLLLFSQKQRDRTRPTPTRSLFGNACIGSFFFHARYEEHALSIRHGRANEIGRNQLNL